MNRDISIYGMGKIGLPLACAFLQSGFRVIGVDKNPEVVSTLNKGVAHIDEPGIEEILEKAVKTGSFKATTDGVKAAKETQAMIVIVPLTIDEKQKPDMRNLIKAIEDISKGLKKGDLVSTETTLPPGTTEKIIKPILEKSGLKAGLDFYLVHAPERTMSGRVLKDFKTYPKIIGGINIKSAEIAAELYKHVFPKVRIVKDARTAEAIKVFEGIYRDVNIALANELAIICENIGLDYWDIMEAANSQPYCNLHKPGTGVGGHCIPVYSHFIINLNPENSFLIQVARMLNDRMPSHIVNLMEKGIELVGIKNPKITILGLSFRGGVKEHRYSPTIILVKELKSRGYNEVTVNDPLYEAHEIREILGVESSNIEESLKRSNVLIIATDHQLYRTIEIPKNVKLIIDGRHILEPKQMHSNCLLITVGKSLNVSASKSDK